MRADTAQPMPGAQEDVIMGLPAGLVAVLVCSLASALSVIGYVLQKRGANAPGREIGDMVISRDWVLGVLLLLCTGAPMDLLAYSIAPLSLTAPLSGLTVALNQALAPRLLGEHTEVFPDYPAAALIAAGTIFTTFNGPRHDPTYTADMLWESLGDINFLWFMLAMTAVVGSSMVFMGTMKEKLARSANMNPSNPNVMEVLMPAIAAGGAGGITNIFLKAVGVLLRSRASYVSIMPWVVLTCAAAAVQLNYISRGLKLYPQTVFMPIYQALLVVLTLLASSSFYKEYRQMGMRPFTGGLSALVSGILMFSLRSGKPDLLSSKAAGAV